MSEWFWQALVAGVGFGIGHGILAALARVLLTRAWRMRECHHCEGIGLVDRN